VLAACSLVDTRIPGPPGMGPETDALLAVASEAVLGRQLLESS
jgi:hypothetical protein